MPLPRLLPLLATAVALAACAPAGPAAETAPRPAPPPATARQLVERMRAQWDGRWYRTLEFRQVNTAYTSAGEQRSEWLERQRVPQRLRIDFVVPQGNGSGVLYRADSAYSFDAGTRTGAVAQVHPLLLLSADAYALPADSTMRLLGRLRVDTTQLRRDRWQERPVYVVGAPANDSTTTQFWVDAERLLLVRLVQAQQAGSRTVVTDHHLTYQEVGGFAVPLEIVFLRGGRPIFRERYTDVRPNAPLDDALFDPARWAQGIPPR
jgi:hypothetical protein